jgi:Dolichyl-phosphate-mannose-protein mannosyltransferase
VNGDDAAAHGPRARLVALAAVGAVLAWFAVQLVPFLGEAPDLDSMVTLRELITFHREGLHGVVLASGGGGVHPPLLDVLSSAAFSLLGEDPRSEQLVSVLLFAVLAVSVERLLAPWLGTGQRILAALAVAICPALAINVFLVSYEGVLVVVLSVALALALAPERARRPFLLAAVLALLPLIKETGLVLAVPFAVHAALTRRGASADTRLLHGAAVLAPAIVAALAWRLVLGLEGASAWHTWLFSRHAGDGPYVVAIRAMLGLERGIFLRQNLTNAFIVNFLWLPTLLAIGTLVLLVRRSAAPGLRSAAALLVGVAVAYTWAVLTFPTYSEPRYAVPLILLTVVLALLGLPLWPARVRPFVLGALLVAFAAGAWSPTDPVSRRVFSTTSVGGEQIYATAELQRGPDRMVYNLAVLRASRRVNARLRRLYATNATLVTGDCDTMKFGEKLSAIGQAPSAYDRGLPGARPLECVRADELPPDAATGRQRIAVFQTPEQQAAGQPPPLSGPSVVLVP